MKAQIVNRTPHRVSVIFLALALLTALIVSATQRPPAHGATRVATPVTVAAQVSSDTRATVVLVHGAFADASGWSGVITALAANRQPVIAWSNPLRGLASDAADLKTFLSTIPGPILLVGHSYGGAVITQVTDNPNVQGVMYVAGYALAEGENVFAANGLDGAHTDLGDNLLFRPITGAGPENADVYVNPSAFPRLLAADLPSRTAAAMALSQRPAAVAAFAAPSAAPAWAVLPSWYVVATDDKAIDPVAQTAMARRAEATTYWRKGSHLIMTSKPSVVADLIFRAVRTLR